MTSVARTAAERERSLPEGSIWGYTWATWNGRFRGSGRLLPRTSYVRLPFPLASVLQLFLFRGLVLLRPAARPRNPSMQHNVERRGRAGSARVRVRNGREGRATGGYCWLGGVAAGRSGNQPRAACAAQRRGGASGGRGRSARAGPDRAGGSWPWRRAHATRRGGRPTEIAVAPSARPRAGFPAAVVSNARSMTSLFFRKKACQDLVKACQNIYERKSARR